MTYFFPDDLSIEPELSVADARNQIESNNYLGAIRYAQGDYSPTDITRSFAETWATDLIKSGDYENSSTIHEKFPFLAQHCPDFIDEYFLEFGPWNGERARSSFSEEP